MADEGLEPVRIGPVVRDPEERVARAEASVPPGVFRFAERVPTDLRPGRDGVWDGRRWRLRVLAEGATTLNFAFDRFRLPAGAGLVVRPTGGAAPYRTFTSEDNKAHGEFWTPLYPHDDVTIELTLPLGSAVGDVDLRLAAVNRGFRGWKHSAGKGKIGGDRSGTCNVDVACGEGDVPFGVLIDGFRDQIRSVGAYTLNGIDTCTGALVNNVRLDGVPYFLTAHHCGVTAASAPSMVVYWNFENTACRPPGSAESGSPGDGSLMFFNSGAELRASASGTDFTLVELDDAPPEDAHVFFAGWDARDVSQPMAVGVHHPAVAEKRISFELDPTSVTSYYSNQPDAGENHLRVADWDHGTTEPGSSGSPLFDDTGRIVGQLHGGGAACGNDAPDWYGRVASSWGGGEVPGSRLRDWLDPDGTGTLFLDGADADEQIEVAGGSVLEGAPGEAPLLSFTLTLAPAAGETVSVTVRTGVAGDADAGDDFVPLGDTVVTFEPGVTAQEMMVEIVGDSVPEEHETVELMVVATDGATGVGRSALGSIVNDDYIPPVITGSPLDPVPAGTQWTYPVEVANTPTYYELRNGPPGMTIGGADGVLRWAPPSPGSFGFEVAAGNPAGEDVQSFTLEVTPNPLVDALDLAPGVTVSVGGNLPWTYDETTTFDGADAARAGAIGDGEWSTLQMDVAGPETVAFWWKVSSEAGYDVLSLRVDGEVVAARSGEGDWERYLLELPAGTHEVRWEYVKDGSVSEGADTAWVDSVRVLSLSPGPLITVPSRVGTLAGAPFHLPLTAEQGPVVWSVDGLPAGVEVTSDSGGTALEGVPLATGIYTVDLEVQGPGGNDASRLKILVGSDPAEAVDLAGGSWSVGGDVPWFEQSSETHDGVDALESGAIGDGQHSAVELEVVGPDTLVFWWNVSSEAGYDELRLELDGAIQDAISGESGWQRGTIKIPGGTHRVGWNYVKDGSVSEGADAGWIDELVLASSSVAPVIVSPLEARGVRGEPFSYQIEALGSPDTFGAMGLPAGLAVDPASGLVSGVPTEVGTFEVTLTVSARAEQASETLDLRIDVALEEALDIAGVSWESGGAAGWSGQTDTFVVGGSAAQSAPVGHDEESVLSAQFVGPGTLLFRWKVSSEAEFDFLAVDVGATAEVEIISGEEGWGEVALPLPSGPVLVAWRYFKDGSVSEGADAGWVDDVRAEGFAGWVLGHGLAPESAGPGLDPEGDGIPMAAEYALGLSATAPDRLPITAEIVAGHLVITVERAIKRDDVLYEVEFSDLGTGGSWAADGTVLEDSPTRLRVRAPSPASRMWGRLRVTLSGGI